MSKLLLFLWRFIPKLLRPRLYSGSTWTHTPIVAQAGLVTQTRPRLAHSEQSFVQTPNAQAQVVPTPSALAKQKPPVEVPMLVHPWVPGVQVTVSHAQPVHTVSPGGQPPWHSPRTHCSPSSQRLKHSPQ